MVELIEINQWEEQRSQAERIVSLFRILVQHMYGQDAEDIDKHPDELESEANQQPQATVEQEEAALRKLLASRQTFEHQVESYERLRKSLQYQEEKRAKENR